MMRVRRIPVSKRPPKVEKPKTVYDRKKEKSYLKEEIKKNGVNNESN